MSRDEKRSDDGLSDERLEGVVRAHRRIHSDEHGADWCGSCGTDWPCNTSRLAAALAAAREDNERKADLIAEFRKRDEVQDRIRNLLIAERDAARVEVSQLRAKLEALDESLALDGYASDHRWRRLLAEPLGSTEDPPPERNSE